jgi:putative endonuclease
MFYIYVLHSEKDGKLYTGYSPNLRNRIKAHKGGFVKATKYRLPFNLIYYEAFIIEQDAKRREVYLKGGNGKKELEKILKSYFKRKPWEK